MLVLSPAWPWQPGKWGVSGIVHCRKARRHFPYLEFCRLERVHPCREVGGTGLLGKGIGLIGGGDYARRLNLPEASFQGEVYSYCLRGKIFTVPIPSICTASLMATAGEVQHLSPWQGVIRQRRPVHCGRPPLWASGTQWVSRGGAGRKSREFSVMG